MSPSVSCDSMGRRGELSDFQRGTVVGCHMCNKSVREISALLNLPRSTVSAVILRWKRGGVTTVLPRSGRPRKLQEEDRQVLEKVALETCLTTVEALTSEFNTASGAEVSVRTVRRELHEMGFRGRWRKRRRSRQRKAKLLTFTQMQNRMAVLLCNLRPATRRGVASLAMIMCASSPDKEEILNPPSGAVPGDRVLVQGFPGEPDKELNPKTRVWELIQPDLWTDSQGVATYMGAAFEVVRKGVCKAQTLSDTRIQ